MRVLIGDTDRPGQDGTIGKSDLEALYAAPSTPWFRVNMVSTLDGAVTGESGRSGTISNDVDQRIFDLLRELKPLLGAIGGTDCTVYEDRSRTNYFMEVFRFKDEAEFTAFDDKFHKDRKIAAIYALLDDIVEAEKSDFKIFERRL